MAQFSTFQPKDNFNTNLWTGNSTTDRAMTGVGFKPDLLWVKGRNEGTDQELNDSVRGSTKYIRMNIANGEGTETESVKSFDVDGYTLGNANYWNWTAKTFAGWSWKAGTTTGITGSPSITPASYSFNQINGFSIIKYVGNGVAGATIPHGLGAVPHFAIFKYLDGAEAWACYHQSIGNGKKLVPNTTESEVTQSTIWNDTSPTSTLFSIGTHANVNTNTINYIAYIFTEKTGYSKFSSYKGNGDAWGPFVYTGFRPAVVIRKRATVSAEYWSMIDTKRLGYNPNNAYLFPNDAGVENAAVTRIDILSNGFKLRSADGADNDTNETYVYAAFAEFPIVSSNSKAGVAR